MKVIIISGSVGTGKTTLAKKLAKETKFKFINTKKLIQENKLNNVYDKKRKCFVIDSKKLNKILIKEIKNNKKEKGIIIESHLSHYLPSKYVDLCIITKCNLKVLEKRLKKRKYNKEKIRENLDCEIFDICLNEAKEKKHQIQVIDTTKKLKIELIKKSIK